MLRLKGQTESGEWEEFYPVDIVDTFEDEIKILLDKEIWVYADMIQPADDPRKQMLENVRDRFLWLFGKITRPTR